MKFKVLVTITLLSLILTLSACSNDKKYLLNDLFENTINDSITDINSLYEEYRNIFVEHYMSIYQEPYNNRTITDDVDFVEWEGYNELPVNRTSMINFPLTNNKYFLESELYYFVYESITFPTHNCEEKCSEVDLAKEGSLYMEGDKLYFEDNRIINGTTEMIFEFYFYKNDNDKLVIQQYKSERQLNNDVYDSISTTTFVEGEYEETYTCESCNIEENVGVLQYRYFDLKTNNYISIEVFENDHKNVKYFLGATQELFSISDDGSPYMYWYSEFDDSVEKISIGYASMTINLMYVDGWDSIDKAEPGFYNIYNEGSIVSPDMVVNYETHEGEYVEYTYFISETQNNPIPSDIVTLSRFGLNSNYPADIFQIKSDYINENYNQIINNYNIDFNYSDIFTLFKSKVEFRFDHKN